MSDDGKVVRLEDREPDLLDELRLSDCYSPESVRKVLTHVPIRDRPSKQTFVRVRPGDEWQESCATFKPEGLSGEIYVIREVLAAEYPDVARRVTL